MSESAVVTIRINGTEVSMPAGSTVGSALVAAGVPCRTSVTGQPRTALCGMGICFECCAAVDGVLHRRTCQLLCVDGMQVETDR
jgi:predicted molibdopterin-dependent oxidoreductase YjgC